MHKILVLQGPNLNLLGQREPAIYGYDTLDDIHRSLASIAEANGVALDCLQSNSESVLIDRIHQALHEKINLILFNPAAFTHTSIALRDALLAVAIPFIEVHLSNIHQREAFRQHSYFSDIAIGSISGFGAASYTAAIQLALQHLSASSLTRE